MLDNRTIELINSAVDDELGSEEQSELDLLLDSSSEAREMHAELIRLGNFLNALPDQKPPPELSHQILGQIRLPRKPSLFSLRGLFESIQPLATAAAFAAGLLLTIGFYELTPRQMSSADLNKMVGTALLSKPDGMGETLDRASLEEGWLTGSVLLRESQGLLVLEFDLDSADTVEIELDLVKAGLKFAGIAQDANQPGMVNDMFQVSGGALRVENQGRQSFVIFLRNIAQKDSDKEFSIEFSNGEERAVKGLLRQS